MSGDGSDRSVTARDITGSSVVTGDQNTVSTRMAQVAPPSDKVDVKAELTALRELLGQLKGVRDGGELDRAMQDAAEETAKPQPDKGEVGGAVERAIRYAKSADDFGDHVENLLPRLTAIASWAGVAGRGLLALVAAAN